jgi:hypothetical protein
MQQLKATPAQLADRDGSVWQREEGVVFENLQGAILPAYSPVFIHRAGFLLAENLGQVDIGGNRLMRIVGISGGHVKTPVQLGKELTIQEGVGGVQSVDASQAHLLNQPVLKDAITPFHASFGLWRVGKHDLDTQGAHCPFKLR